MFREQNFQTKFEANQRSGKLEETKWSADYIDQFIYLKSRLLYIG